MSVEREDRRVIPEDNVISLPSIFKARSFPLLPTKPRHFDGPISTEMWGKIKDLKSNYPDTFDWTVYDKIAERFGKDQPRGGVVFRTTFKLVNYHTSCSKCHYAFEIDSYGRGCIHNCVYCYAKDQLSTHGFWNRPMPFPVDLSEVRKIMYTVFETDKPHKWRSVLELRTPIRIGSMSDSFMWMDQKYGVTKELIKILNFYRYPHIVFTRSDLIAEDEYLNLLDPDLISVQFSISGGNEEITKIIEPGAPSVKRRLAALKKLHSAGFWTTVRINPFFPMRPDGFYTDEKSIIQRFGSKDQTPKFDLFSWDFLDQLKDSNVPSVLAGVVRLSPKAINTLSNVTGLNFKSFFKPEIMGQHGDKKYSDSEIAFYYGKFYEECKRRNIRFNTCYIGNGQKDYYQYQSFWSNKSDCCDAVGSVKSFNTTCQKIAWTERLKHSPSKEIAKSAQSQDAKFSEKFETEVNP